MATFRLGLALFIFAAIIWIALAFLRGGASTGASKRASAFGAIVYIEILLGSITRSDPAGSTLANVTARPQIILHVLGALVVAVAALWVWRKTSSMTGYVRLSAGVILSLAILTPAIGLAIAFSGSPIWSSLHQTVAISLFGAAVWHAYELRIYPVVAVT